MDLKIAKDFWTISLDLRFCEDNLWKTGGTHLAGENGSMPDVTNISQRSGRDLFNATTPFAEESTIRSWWYVCSTLGILVALLTVAAVAPWSPIRLAASVAGGLVLVRVFILRHDFMRG